MNEAFNDYAGFFKFKGKLVEDGYLDARKTADTMIGIDQVIR